MPPHVNLVRFSALRGVWTISAAAALIAFAAIYFQHAWAPRRRALQSLQRLQTAVFSNDGGAILSAVRLPEHISRLKAPEQAEWAETLLRAELSPRGLIEMQKHARFGRLLDLFPDEGSRWATAAGAPADRCLAFRMERAGIRAEVVLEPTSADYRIIRCNNVAAMAAPP